MPASPNSIGVPLGTLLHVEDVRRSLAWLHFSFQPLPCFPQQRRPVVLGGFSWGWLSPSYVLTKLFLVCIWVPSALSSSSLSSHPIIWGILPLKHISSPCFLGQGHPRVFPAGMLALKVTAGGG